MSDLCPKCNHRGHCYEYQHTSCIETCSDYSKINGLPRVYKISRVPMVMSEIKDAAKWQGWTWDRLSKCQCGCNDWILLPDWSEAVREGGKRYLVCAHCGNSCMHL